MHHAGPSGVSQHRRVCMMLEYSSGELLARSALMHHDKGHDALIHYAVLKALRSRITGAKTADFIQSLDNNYQKVLLFGHNYAFTCLVNSLGSIYIDNLPTSGLVLLNFDVHSWKDVKKGTTELMLFPKHLK